MTQAQPFVAVVAPEKELGSETCASLLVMMFFLRPPSADAARALLGKPQLIDDS